jgi:hypothetical protein
LIYSSYFVYDLHWCSILLYNCWISYHRCGVGNCLCQCSDCNPESQCKWIDIYWVFLFSTLYKMNLTYIQILLLHIAVSSLKLLITILRISLDIMIVIFFIIKMFYVEIFAIFVIIISIIKLIIIPIIKFIFIFVFIFIRLSFILISSF